MDVTPNLLHGLAELSRLDISAAETTTLQQQLPKIIDYVGQLQTTATTIVPAVRDEHAPLRDDLASRSAAITAILDQAPERLETFWKVSGVFS